MFTAAIINVSPARSFLGLSSCALCQCPRSTFLLPYGRLYVGSHRHMFRICSGGLKEGVWSSTASFFHHPDACWSEGWVPRLQGMNHTTMLAFYTSGTKPDMISCHTYDSILSHP